MTYPQIRWDCGTAYDFFISLEVLHNPSQFGVRPAWTAGMRARLSPDDRKTFEQLIGSSKLMGISFEFLYNLPEPKDGNALLWALSRLAPEERLSIIEQGITHCYPDAARILSTVAQQQSWDEHDQEHLKAALAESSKKKSRSPQQLINVLEWWAHPAESGERYLKALRGYYEVFFAEEEKRIRPVLQEALEQARELAGKLLLPDLIEELSQGIRFSESEWSAYAEIVLVPSFWITPFLYSGKISATCGIHVFGARPAHISLIPGEAAPDLMTKALKALSDPTRLCILQYLSKEPLSPAQLAKRLRLRAPTITHHLRTLRLAGLVRILKEETQMTCYTARSSAIEDLCASLKAFLKSEEAREE